MYKNFGVAYRNLKNILSQRKALSLTVFIIYSVLLQLSIEQLQKNTGTCAN